MTARCKNISLQVFINQVLISEFMRVTCTDVPVVHGSWFDSAHHDKTVTKR